MAYDVTTVTIKGTELLAAASAADNLVLAGCDATQTYIAKAAAVNVSARPANPFSNTTNVRLEGATDGHIFIRIFFVATESTGGDVRSLYLYGHSADDPSNDYVIAVMSSEDPFHLPEAGDISNTYGTLLDVKFNVADGSVSSVTTSVFATYSEYADLRDRAVTTHKQGQATVGDNQIIYGTKTFENTIIGDSGTSPFIKQNVSDNFNAQLGGVATHGLSYEGNSFYFYESNLNFYAKDNAHFGYIGDGISTDICDIKFNVDSITDGITRCFGVNATHSYNNSTKTLSKVYACMDRKYISYSPQPGQITASEKEAGRVLLQADEFYGTNSAKVELKVDYDAQANSYTQFQVDAEICNITATDSSDNTVYNTLYVTKSGWGMISQNGSYKRELKAELSSISGILSIYPDYAVDEDPCVDLGYGAHQFRNVYATTVYATSFIGNLTGSATSATKDASGNAITSYFRTWGTSDGSSIIAKLGDGTSTSGVSINSACAYSAQGKAGSTSSAYSAVGGIGLFLYTGSATSKAPGDTVSGSDLKPASIMKEYSTGDFKIISNGSVSGTWTLLSYFSTSSSGDAALVLAVKTSTT